MKLYRFSPIKTKDELLKAIEHVHFESYRLCKQSFGKYFANAENMGIFCQYDDEYETLTNIRKELTEESDNMKQKYFRLLEPIVIPAKGDVPEQTYSYLYIRRPDPYRHQVGDADFYLPPEKYAKLKQEMLAGKKVKGARIFDRPDLDMIELYAPDIDVLTYVSTSTIAESVRVKLSEHTKL
ncbi:hypothetical protein A2886_02815 [candidate division WWE3 bacterium RIFCSPHIGHO2_01_FULL_42_13]|uniref:Uncharacterized protein n=1 Tax=candidate division WWE3 bacterium RIFCSPHIGHO2_01_FULL_42_13 TaxID=1802617 RepID=A0A1F4URV8_UNCKA|nr:MAG: hypothetical protein A2886_02815 [candidate division WWE3 bacterium RIFCSPHIGHO2_01_FULL_42_13]